MRGAAAGLVLALLLVPAVGLTQPAAPSEDKAADPLQRLGLTGSLRGAYWSSSRELDEGEHFFGTALWLKAAPKLLDNLSLVAEGWVRNQDLFHADATDGRLREGYLDAHWERLDVRVGRQIIAWGRADRINPTDNLTPRDYTLLAPEDDDQRLGVAAGKVTLTLGAGAALTGIWLPEFEPHTIPLRKTPGVTLRDRTPGETLGRWALKLEQSGGAVDWSLSFYDGVDLIPDFAVDRAGLGFLDVVLKHHRIRVVGADAATTLGRFGLRGEAAFTFTEDPHGDKPHVKNPFFFLVLGADRTFGESLNVNLQYLFRFVVHHRSPVDLVDPVVRAVATDQALVANELDAIQHGASLRVSRKWMNETLETEVQGVLTLTRLDFAARPKVTYALTDRWRVTVGADVFRGERRSFFGRLRDNTTAYAELRWSF